ncbi:DUF6364 family protein [Hymenobacter cellulosilyticus]|uniref:DUF6364 family protein n=1 Tax=Hymenobacter cellulosilyticus TaxID=2932248 RepID=A0A8T9QG20_9BACT|nr:DUF6364 family protein [Hymenobacter cellulosilyticus]UOQ74509.1 DUF6364 family protein [Hymenobacter cellulosilyticus]
MIRLTLNLPDEVAQRAQAYARETGRSLEDIFAAYLQQLKPDPAALPELPPALARLKGAVQLPPDADYKTILAEELQKRFGQ